MIDTEKRQQAYPGEFGNRRALAFLTSPEHWQDPALQREWKFLLDGSCNHNVMHQSPQWLAYLHATGQGDPVAVAVARNAAGNLRGVVPLCIHQGALQFDVAGRNLWSVRLREISLLGGEPLLPPDKDLYDRFFLSIREAFPDYESIFLGTLPCASFAWRYLHESEVIRRHYLPYYVDGISNYYMIPLAPTFTDFQTLIGRKKRYNLKRQHKQLGEICEKESNSCASSPRPI